MSKKLFSYLCFFVMILFILPSATHAQSKTFDNVFSAQLKNMGPIIKDKVVQGYYMFYKVDKIDRKTNEYLLQILDANLNVLGSKKIVDSKHVVLLESAYNGENILMKFYDKKAKSIDYRSYNKNAEQVFKKSRKLEKRWELAAYSSVAAKAEISNKTVFPVQDKGFVEYSIKKEKKTGYEIKFFPNTKEEKGWKKGSKPDSKEHETATFIGVNDHILLSQVTKNKNITNTKNISYHLLAMDAKTGKKVFQKALTDTRYELAILNAYLKEDGSEEIAVLGQFYKKGDNIVKSKSLGLFSFVYDKEGKILHKNFAKWEKDVGKFVSVNSRGKMEDVGYVYFHEIIQTADGKIFAVGETFRRTASALGIAAVALGGGGSVTKIVIEDMVIFEFSPSFELQDVKFFDKSKTNVELGDGGDFTKIMVLGRILETYGHFDYSFTQRSTDNSEFMVGYVDYQRNKGASNQVVFGALVYADGEINTDKLPLSFPREKRYKRVFSAKPGYIMVTEYKKKQKTLDMSLEKINF